MITLLMLAAAASECYSLDHGRILGSDLAGTSAIFAALPPDLVIGNAPVPGARRLFEPAELIRIAQANHLETADFTPLCFERPTAVLDPELVREAMQKSLGAVPASIEILTLSKYPAPRGDLIFPRDSLVQPASGDIAIWNGYVAYDGGRFAVWARIRLTTLQSRLVSVVDLIPGHIVEAADLRLEEVNEFPGRLIPLTRIGEAVGQVTRRSIPAFSVLTATMLGVPNDVERGQTVMVEVHSGAVVIKVDGRAETAGHRGDTISVRNLTSGMVFHAEIEGKGHVRVNCLLLSEVSQ